jgi:aspartate ammonia-lyase
VIPEVVNQVCFDIIGGDVTVTMAAARGAAPAQRLRAGDRLPTARRAQHAAQRLRRAARALRHGITANPDRMRWFVEHSIGIVTALVPVLGYETASEIAKAALESGRGVYDLVCERGLLTRDELDRLLNPEAMVGAH